MADTAHSPWRLGAGWLVSVAFMLVLSASLPFPLSAQSNSQRNAVLAVNTEFYRAFREGDLPAMDRVWGRR